MSRSLRDLTEQQIRKAIAEGQLENLEGAGKPLPDRSGEAGGDMAMQIGARIMAEAGALPREFQIKKALEAARTAYANAATDAEKRIALAVIADLELRYNIEVEARKKFLRP